MLSPTPMPDMLLVWGEVGRDPYTLPARELSVTIWKNGIWEKSVTKISEKKKIFYGRCMVIFCSWPLIKYKWKERQSFFSENFDCSVMEASSIMKYWSHDSCHMCGRMRYNAPQHCKRGAKTTWSIGINFCLLQAKFSRVYKNAGKSLRNLQ
jgi:hypothetical protein